MVRWSPGQGFRIPHSALPSSRALVSHIRLPFHCSSNRRYPSQRPTPLTIVNGRRASDPIVAPVIKLDEEEFVDLQTHMLRNRIIFLGERVNDQVAVKVVASLIALNTLSTTEEIKMYINSAAGSSYAVVSILDTLRAIKAPVSTVAFGMVGGNCVQLLAAGTRGRRFSMRSTRILLQQPNGGAQGSADEVNIQTTELNRTMRMMYTFLSENTGLDMERIEEECDRDSFLSAEMAKELGIIDGVIGD